MAPKDIFSTFDVVKLLGIKRERLKEWMSRGYIKPSIQEAAGVGTKAIFSLDDLYLIALFQYLVERGFSRRDVAARIKSIYWLQGFRKRGALLPATYHEIIGADFLGFTRNPEVPETFGDHVKRMGGSEEDLKEFGEFVEIGVMPEVWNAGKKKGGLSITTKGRVVLDCDDLLLVNFKKIRERVNDAIGRE